MSFDTPIVEYLIIGTHTMLWLVILLAKFLSIPLQSLVLDPALILLALPFAYLLGMVFDELAFRPLNSIRKKIRDGIYDPSICKDEFIANASQELYTAYEARMRRVRIVGAAIFNWPLLGIAILLHMDFANLTVLLTIIITSIILCIVSFTTWKNLTRRAYKFRKNACDILLKNASQMNNVEVSSS